jgi:hypothetical protein
MACWGRRHLIFLIRRQPSRIRLLLRGWQRYLGLPIHPARIIALLDVLLLLAEVVWGPSAHLLVIAVDGREGL